MAPIEFDRRKARIQGLEHRLTPLEIVKILEEGDHEQLPFIIRPLLESGVSPVGYIRESWSEHVNYYTANRGARSLIVAFRHLGVPTAYFLQMLRDDLYDVLVLYDRSKLYFDRGIPGFSDSLFDTTRLIEAFAKSKGYDRVITYGASVGGFPALRAGLLLGADRAISVGGKYCWHVARLLRNGATVGAFDVLCPCFSERPVEMVAVSAQNRADMRALEILRGTFPSSHVLPVDTQLHNVVEYLHRVRLLRLFMPACSNTGTATSAASYWRC